MIENSIISFLTNTSTNYAANAIAALVGNRAHYTKIPKNQKNLFTRLFLRRSNRNTLGNIDGSGKEDYCEDDFDLEVISNNPSEVAIISDKLWSDVNLHYGSITSTKTVKGMFLENQDDDYEPKGTGGDLGLDVSSFSLRVIHDNTTT